MPEFVHIKQGLSLLELGSYFLDFELIISNDCGPMHIAAALGCPLIAVFGPTDENKWFPYRGVRQLSFRLGKAPPSGRDLLVPGQYWPYWPLPESIAISAVALMEDDN
jgi:ADP-heptose:LPS heptosyltransferase